MINGVQRIGSCISGVLCSARFGYKSTGFLPPRVSEILIATPLSLRVLLRHQRIQEALADNSFDMPLSFGLAMAYYHGPGSKRFLGLQLNNWDKDYFPAALPGITAKDFPALAKQEERLFLLAQASLTDPDLPVSRLLLLASNDITTEGVENLPTDLYQRLIYNLLQTKRIPLETIRHIEVSDEKPEANQQGVVVVSIATLQAELKRANLHLENISAAPLLAAAN